MLLYPDLNGRLLEQERYKSSTIYNQRVMDLVWQEFKAGQASWEILSRSSPEHTMQGGWQTNVNMIPVYARPNYSRTHHHPHQKRGKTHPLTMYDSMIISSIRNSKHNVVRSSQSVVIALISSKTEVTSI